PLDPLEGLDSRRPLREPERPPRRDRRRRRRIAPRCARLPFHLQVTSMPLPKAPRPSPHETNARPARLGLAVMLVAIVLAACNGPAFRYQIEGDDARRLVREAGKDAITPVDATRTDTPTP